MHRRSWIRQGPTGPRPHRAGYPDHGAVWGGPGPPGCGPAGCVRVRRAHRCGLQLRCQGTQARNFPPTGAVTRTTTAPCRTRGSRRSPEEPAPSSGPGPRAAVRREGGGGRWSPRSCAGSCVSAPVAGTGSGPAPARPRLGQKRGQDERVLDGRVGPPGRDGEASRGPSPRAAPCARCTSGAVDAGRTGPTARCARKSLNRFMTPSAMARTRAGWGRSTSCVRGGSANARSCLW